jgi:hypothetical protein
MQHKQVMCALVLTALVGSGDLSLSSAATPKKFTAANCRRAVVEGDVKAGESFTKEFAKGFEFRLEAIPSGWIVRVLPTGVPRGEHDVAELATPPYKSVTPLAVSTDFAFRAQDAVAWNPRRFGYAADAASARRLAQLYPAVLANDPKAAAEAASLALQQPQAELQILSAVLVPGTANQWRMAAAVASHLEMTPHDVVQGEQATPLGRLAELKFRVRLELPPGIEAAKGVEVERIPCAVKPTS